MKIRVGSEWHTEPNLTPILPTKYIRAQLNSVRAALSYRGSGWNVSSYLRQPRTSPDGFPRILHSLEIRELLPASLFSMGDVGCAGIHILV